MSNDLSPGAYAVWLASAALSNDILLEILSRFQDAEVFHHAFTAGKDEAVSLIPERYRSALRSNAHSAEINRCQTILKENGIQSITINDSDYPTSLRPITDPPAILFYQGDLSILTGSRILSVVGSRTASYIGQKATKQITQELSRKGVIIVSGLANGIDTAAHQGCLEGESPTIAVLGSGLCNVYPRNNLQLRNSILEKDGLIFSEYMPHEKPNGWHFPIRNRILAGLGQALIFMEGRIRSGSMTTVQHALNQGKDVFVFPGDPLSPYFEGNHQLLREGAIYFTKSEDILDDLGWLDNPIRVRQNIDCSEVPDTVSSTEKTVINALKPGSLSFEQLINLTELSPQELMTALTMLQINGRIESLPGKTYALKA